MKAPLISIVIPCYNQGRYLQEAVASAFAQSHRPLEVIVVDDGSTEDIERAVTGTGAVYVRQENQGVAAARNRGVQESSGNYLVFLDSDDRLLPDALADGLRALAEQPHAAFAAGLCRIIGARGELRPFRQQPEVGEDRYEALLEQNFIWMPGQILHRRSAFVASGGFDASVNACADYDLYLRTARAHPIVCHRLVVAEYRNHEGSMSNNALLMLRQALTVLQRQWRFARRSPRHRAAFRRGWRFWQELYGDHAIQEIRASVRSPGERWRAVRTALVLLGLHPVCVARHAARKAYCLLTRQADDGTAPLRRTDTPTGEAVRSEEGRWPPGSDRPLAR